MSCAPPVALRECQSRLLPGESTAQACAQDVHAPCTIGTQVSAECNQSLYTTAQPRTYTSGANARAEPEKVALLLPQSPAANTERVSSMSGTPTVADGAHCGQSSGRSSEKAGAGHAYRAEGAGCVDKGGVRSSGNVPEQDVQVFADTLGMQGGGMAVSEILRSTFPQPRSPLAPPVPFSAMRVDPGSAGASPHKTGGGVGSPIKAPKVAGAAQASADPGVSSPDKGPRSVLREGAADMHSAQSSPDALKGAGSVTSRGAHGVHGDDGNRRYLPSSPDPSKDRDFGEGGSPPPRVEADYSGVVAIDYVNCSIVRANLGAHLCVCVCGCVCVLASCLHACHMPICMPLRVMCVRRDVSSVRMCLLNG